ncbi:hypothetical protein [Streptomyces sp. NPDC006335]|uniref:hypothetical protein n=1 Tax=Streptomyces sp. NPDC006335 TaxID=3156895 RepID=UPI0033AA96F0
MAARPVRDTNLACLPAPVLTSEGTELRERLPKVLAKEPLFAALTQDEQDTLEDPLKRALPCAEILQAWRRR